MSTAFALKQAVKTCLFSPLTPWASPRRSGPHPVRLCFVFHVERVHDRSTFDALVTFADEFVRRSGTRIVACVMTPECPSIRREMERAGVGEAEFADRLGRLSERATIGYHGHFYRDRDPDRPIHHAAFDAGSLRAQLDRECEWLAAHGHRPWIYTGGWWFLHPDTVRTLGARGFRLDFSIRHEEPDCFGGRFFEAGRAPSQGAPFRHAEGGTLLGVQSLAGPIDPPFWTVRRHLAPVLSRIERQPAWGALHAHDYDLPDKSARFLSNVGALSVRGGPFVWCDAAEIESTAREALARCD